MINNEWYDTFMETLNKKYPKKNQLAEALIDLLCIEREAVYRRLRKYVIFPANEIVKIASAWNISLDETVGIKSKKVLFQMYPVNYLTPSDEDIDFMQKKVYAIKQFKLSSDSEYILVCNFLAWSLTARFTNLYKFHIFKWAYEYCNGCNNYNKKPNTTFSEMIISEELLNEIDIYHQHLKNVTNTTYILDSMIFDNYVRDIQFFHSILLLTDEEKELLKKELYALLDYMLEIANKGYFPETKNRVDMYVSILHINTNYSYLYNGKTEDCCIHAFNMYDVTSCNQEMIDKFKTLLKLKERTSFKISETDERSRIEFFMKQRQLVYSL